jgi:hypothetical protein
MSEKVFEDTHLKSGHAHDEKALKNGEIIN